MQEWLSPQSCVPLHVPEPFEKEARAARYQQAVIKKQAELSETKVAEQTSSSIALVTILLRMYLPFTK